MNLEQAKMKLDSVSKSTATKHPKALIGELCAVVSFLLTEIERIKTPTMTFLPQDSEVRHDPPLLERRLPQPPWPIPNSPQTSDTPPSSDKSSTHIPGYPTPKKHDNTNAGDAK